MELDIIRNMLCTELKKFNTLKSINRMELEQIHLLADTIKDLDKIKMLSEVEAGNITEESVDIMSEEDKMVIKKALELLNR